MHHSSPLDASDGRNDRLSDPVHAQTLHHALHYGQYHFAVSGTITIIIIIILLLLFILHNYLF